jgi:pantetheine-phosphate adenylyltransferase
MSLAIVPGSFDPMTMGHFDLINRVAKDYDEDVVAVMINAQKQYLFDLATRLEIAQATVGELSNVRVIADEGMLIHLFDRLGADAVCNGWRNEADYAYETEMAEWNLAHNPKFVTRLYPSEGHHAMVSSTQVRALLQKGELPKDLLHPRAYSTVKMKKL